MIGKITTGSSGRRLVRYLFGPGKANEHSDQRVITSGLVMGGEALAGGNLSKQQIADLGAGLDGGAEEARGGCGFKSTKGEANDEIERLGQRGGRDFTFRECVATTVIRWIPRC